MEVTFNEDFNINKLNINNYLKSIHSKNGARIGKFRTYRKFCSARILKLRKRNNLNYGKKFNQKVNLMININNDIYEIFLLKCEKYWGFYKEKKMLLKNNPEKIKYIKKDVKKNISKCLKYSENFKKINEIYNDKMAILNSKAYHYFILGHYYIEFGNFKLAKENLLNSFNLYNQISELVSSIEAAVIKEKSKLINEAIKFCKYSLREFKDIKEIGLIEENLEVILNELNKENLNKIENLKIYFLNKEIVVENIDLIKIIKEIEILSNENKNETDNDLFLQILNKYDEGIKISKKEKNENDNNEFLNNLYSSIIDYFSYNKFKNLNLRNFSLLKNGLEKIDLNDIINKITTEVYYKNIKPQEIVRLCENYLEIIRLLTEIQSRYEFLSEEIYRNEIFIRYIKGLFVCIFHSNNNNFQVSLSLAIYLKELIEKELNVNNLDGINISKNQILNFLKIIIIKSKIILSEGERKILDNLPKDFDKLNIINQKTESLGSLLDIVHQRQKIEINDDKKTLPFVSFPPKIKLIYSKPILMDLISTLIDYPEIKIKEQEKKGGLFSGLKSKLGFN